MRACGSERCRIGFPICFFSLFCSLTFLFLLSVLLPPQKTSPPTQRTRARFLLTSTSEVYGDPLEHPQTESYWGNVNPIGERSCYDEGKRAAECLTFDYRREHGLDVARRAASSTPTARAWRSTTGAWCRNFVAQALTGQPMTVYGDGQQTRSFQYVSDLVAGMVAVMEGREIFWFFCLSFERVFFSGSCGFWGCVFSFLLLEMLSRGVSRSRRRKSLLFKTI